MFWNPWPVTGHIATAYFVNAKMWMLTFNVILGYRGLLFRDFLWLFLSLFFSIRLTDPISGNAFEAKQKKRGDGLSWKKKLNKGSFSSFSFGRMWELDCKMGESKILKVHYRGLAENVFSFQTSWKSRKYSENTTAAYHKSILLLQLECRLEL